MVPHYPTTDTARMTRAARDAEDNPITVPADMKYEEYQNRYLKETLPKVKKAKDTTLQNTLEEKEDELFISSMRKLHVEEQDVRNIIAWREIYTYLEKCADACEHVADIVGSVAMKNS